MTTEETRPTMRDMLDIIHWSCNDECDEESHVFTPAEQGVYKALFEHVLGIVAVQVGEVAAEWSRTVDATVQEAERQVAQAKAEALRDAVERGSIELYEPGGYRTAAVTASWLLAEASLSTIRPAAPSQETCTCPHEWMRSGGTCMCSPSEGHHA